MQQDPGEKSKLEDPREQYTETDARLHREVLRKLHSIVSLHPKDTHRKLLPGNVLLLAGMPLAALQFGLQILAAHYRVRRVLR